MMGKLFVVLFALVAVTWAAPAPAPWGGGHHEHHIIHVPYHVHHVHHHHVEKIPIIKHVPVYKEVHVPVYKEIHVPVYKQSHGWSGGWW